MNLVGKRIEYTVNNGEVREGEVVSVSYHEGIGKDLYTCVSPFGNYFRLSREEFTLKEAKVNV